ncbi:MAG: hypothetical protein V1733_02950 [bacterium]
MKSAYISFLKNLLLFSLVIVVILIGLSFILSGKFFSQALPFLFPFFITTALISYYLMIRSLQKRFTKFVNRFMLATGLKLVWYLGVMVTYVLLFKADAIQFVINFFILYLCYTIFETVAIVNYSKSFSGTNPPNPS